MTQSITILGNLHLLLQRKSAHHFAASRKPGLFAHRSGKAPQFINVHQRQGSLDGACGPYAVAMALSLHGVNTDARSLRARMSNSLSQLQIDPLVVNGTTGDHLSDIVSCLSPRWAVEPIVGAGTAEGLRTLAGCIDLTYPAIIGLSWPGGGGHWTVAVGYQGDSSSPERVFLLDSESPRPQITFWNALIERQNVNGPVRYRYADTAEGLDVIDGVSIFDAYRLVHAPPKAPKKPSRRP